MRNKLKFLVRRIFLGIFLWGQLILFSGQSKVDIQANVKNEFVIGETKFVPNKHLEAIRVLGW